MLIIVLCIVCCLFFLFFFFFFSSRRRHTRLQGDWSSDVCSSDLGLAADPALEQVPDEFRLEPPDGGSDGVLAREEHGAGGGRLLRGLDVQRWRLRLGCHTQLGPLEPGGPDLHGDGMTALAVRPEYQRGGA